MIFADRMDLYVTGALACLGSFSLGVAFGLWRRHRACAEHYRMGRTAGQNETRALYGKPIPDDVPRLQPRVAPFAGRQPPDVEG